MTKEPRIYNGEKTVSSINGVRKIGQPHAKEWNGTTILLSYIKVNLKWIKGASLVVQRLSAHVLLRWPGVRWFGRWVRTWHRMATHAVVGVPHIKWRKMGMMLAQGPSSSAKRGGLAADVSSELTFCKNKNKNKNKNICSKSTFLWKTKPKTLVESNWGLSDPKTTLFIASVISC